MEETYNLQRFLDVQNQSYSIAFNEIKSGKKQSHWMWYIFPQFIGLGKSTTSIKYAIKSKEEAIAYYHNKILGKRLIEITEQLIKIQDKTAFEIFGGPDDLKLKSCMSLFALVQNENNIFQEVLDKYFEGKISYKTKELLNKKDEK
jgi:uncharacterized protein (DUF1810 family)